MKYNTVGAIHESPDILSNAITVGAIHELPLQANDAMSTEAIRESPKQESPQHSHRRSLRLKGHDYSKAGSYFITICIKDMVCMFGKITNGEMTLNKYGTIANKYLTEIPEKYNLTRLHEFVVMPNHIHAIIEITGSSTIGAIHESPKQELTLRDQRRKMLLSKIVGWYKMNTAKQINIIRQMEGSAFWQRNYYEHIIRNEKSYQTIADYIMSNPIKWQDDKFYKYAD